MLKKKKKEKKTRKMYFLGYDFFFRKDYIPDLYKNVSKF